MRIKLSTLSLVFVAIIVGLASFTCNPVSSYEETIDAPVLGFITDFQVPDTSYQTRIPVKLVGIFGGTSAFHFDRINTVQTDSLIQIGVWGRQVELPNVQYTPGDVVFDTTLILKSTRTGVHLIELFAANGIFVDTTMVF